ncbi:MAG: hypothetical protein JW966_14700 [Anaerolineae bacterium]|nr:hypothetical protein [Anaerolineae bacterium]
MGIKLDWQVEYEQEHLYATEDPGTRRKRRRARVQLLFLIALLVGVIALGAWLVLWRIDMVADHRRQDLIDTAQIETTALRLGDYASFITIQRSEDPNFMLEQSREFEEYQELKQAHRVELPGTVVDVSIDGRTGRVVIEEIIDGVPYHVVWFYWYYDDNGSSNPTGWRRVPDNLAFWGDAAETSTGDVRVTYHDLDADLAEALAPMAALWWQRGCEVLQCTTVPDTLHIDIVAEKPTAVEWTTYDPWTLRVTSPLTGRSRADVSFAPELQLAVIEQIAGRLVRHATGSVLPVAYSDAAWLHDELAAWLGSTLAAEQGLAMPGSPFFDALIRQYGPGAQATALHTLRADSTLDTVLSGVTGVPLAMLSVDQSNDLAWNDFFRWRLTLESRLLNQPDSGGAFLTLYDLEDQASANEATLRLESPAYAARPVPQVIAVAITRDDATNTYAFVETARTENGIDLTETIVWRLAGGTWKRSN